MTAIPIYGSSDSKAETPIISQRANIKSDINNQTASVAGLTLVFTLYLNIGNK